MTGTRYRMSVPGKIMFPGMAGQGSSGVIPIGQAITLDNRFYQD